MLKVSSEISNALTVLPNPEIKWDEFAMGLMGTNNGSVNQIKQRNSGYGDRCKALLEYWKTTTKELHWDLVVAVLQDIGLHRPARILNEAITCLKPQNLGQTSLEEVDPTHQTTHQPIPQASNDSEGTHFLQ